jgi:hypothetical protein
VSSFYFRRIYGASVVLALLITYGLGARRSILVAMWLAFFPIYATLRYLAAKFEPPRLVLSDDYSLDLNSRIRRGPEN